MPTLEWGRFREGVVGFEEASTMWGMRLGVLTGNGLLLVNKNVERRVSKMGGFGKIPSDWIVAYDNEWVYRIASPTYVDVPPSVVEGILMEYGKPMVLGNWGTWVRRSEGATYANFTVSFNRSNSARVGDFVNGLRITFGNDGYTAFKVTRFLGILACENGLVTGVNDVERLLHAKHFNTVIERIRRTLRLFTAEPFSEEKLTTLERTPVDRRLLEKAFSKIDDFGRLWNLYSQRHGESQLALAQALSWFTTHGGKTKAKAAERLLLQVGA